MEISIDPEYVYKSVEMRPLKMTTNAQLQDTIWEWPGIEAMIEEGNTLRSMYLESVSPRTQLATWKRSSTSPLDWLKLPHECDGSVLHLSFSILYIGQR